MNIVIIKYNAGNIQSVLYALERIGAEAVVTDDTLQIQQASKVIFPGVGEASTAMQYLRERKLDEVIKNLTQPVLGICLGMQLMCSHTEENDTSCMNIFNVPVKRFATNDASLKIPQIGWNSIFNLQSPLFNGVAENAYVYLVHSYYADLCDETIATCNYIQTYTAGLRKNNFYGVQFHPEKSADDGEQILKNFLHPPLTPKGE